MQTNRTLRAPIRKFIAAFAISINLAACDGAPRISVLRTDLADNEVDRIIDRGGWIKDDALLAKYIKKKLAELEIDRDPNRLRDYLVSIGASCRSNEKGGISCRYVRFREYRVSQLAANGEPISEEWTVAFTVPRSGPIQVQVTSKMTGRLKQSDRENGTPYL
jgi:hypothetical protein